MTEGTLPPSFSTSPSLRRRRGDGEVGNPVKKESCLPIALILHLGITLNTESGTIRPSPRLHFGVESKLAYRIFQQGQAAVMLADEKTLRNHVEPALHRQQQSTWKPAPDYPWRHL